MAVGKIQGTVFVQLPVDAEIHLTPAYGGIGHGFLVTVHALVTQFFQIAAPAGADPAPTLAAAGQLGFPAPGIVRSPGSFEFEFVLFALFGNDIDHAAGGVVVDKTVACRTVQYLNTLNGHDRGRHIQVVSGPAVGETACQILFPSVDEHGDTVVAIDADNLMVGIDGTGGNG